MGSAFERLQRPPEPTPEPVNYPTHHDADVNRNWPAAGGRCWNRQGERGHDGPLDFGYMACFRSHAALTIFFGRHSLM
jgi:hypothetical protein